MFEEDLGGALDARNASNSASSKSLVHVGSSGSPAAAYCVRYDLLAVFRFTRLGPFPLLPLVKLQHFDIEIVRWADQGDCVPGVE